MSDKKIFQIPVTVTGTMLVEIYADSLEAAGNQVRNELFPNLLRLDAEFGHGLETTHDLKDATEIPYPYPYPLTDNQYKFVKDVENQGFEIYFTYSGRGMYGEKCPAVDLHPIERLMTDAEYYQDSMGRDTVLYCPR